MRRTDIELVNKKGLKLQCSHFEPINRVQEELPCVIYLHANSSSRVEGYYCCDSAWTVWKACFRITSQCFVLTLPGAGFQKASTSHWATMRGTMWRLLSTTWEILREYQRLDYGAEAWEQSLHLCTQTETRLLLDSCSTRPLATWSSSHEN